MAAYMEVHMVVEMVVNMVADKKKADMGKNG